MVKISSFHESKKIDKYLLENKEYLIVTDEEEVFINSTGNAYMGIAGSGDVLSSLITSFLAQTDKLLNAAKFGVYIHGLTEDLIETKEYPVNQWG